MDSMKRVERRTIQEHVGDIISLPAQPFIIAAGSSASRLNILGQYEQEQRKKPGTATGHEALHLVEEEQQIGSRHQNVANGPTVGLPRTQQPDD